MIPEKGLVSADELQRRIDAYFEKCEMDNRMPTNYGLAYHLGMTYKDLKEYSLKPDVEKSAKHMHVIEMAKTRLAIPWEEALVTKKHTKSDFWLKEAGWDAKDKDAISKTEIKLVVDKDDAEL